MSTASPKSGFVREMSRWYLCVVLAMAAQMLLLLLWSFLGPGSLDGIMETAYVSTAHGIGTLFFEEQMFPGNIPLGLSLLFLTAMLYSVVIGTVFYTGNKLYDKYMPRKAAGK